MLFESLKVKELKRNSVLSHLYSCFIFCSHYKFLDPSLHYNLGLRHIRKNCQKHYFILAHTDFSSSPRHVCSSCTSNFSYQFLNNAQAQGYKHKNLFCLSVLLERTKWFQKNRCAVLWDRCARLHVVSQRHGVFSSDLWLQRAPKMWGASTVPLSSESLICNIHTPDPQSLLYFYNSYREITIEINLPVIA